MWNNALKCTTKTTLATTEIHHFHSVQIVSHQMTVN